MCSLSGSFPGRRMRREALSFASFLFFPDLQIIDITLHYGEKGELGDGEAQESQRKISLHREQEQVKGTPPITWKEIIYLRCLHFKKEAKIRWFSRSFLFLTCIDILWISKGISEWGWFPAACFWAWGALCLHSRRSVIMTRPTFWFLIAWIEDLDIMKCSIYWSARAVRNRNNNRKQNSGCRGIRQPV